MILEFVVLVFIRGKNISTRILRIRRGGALINTDFHLCICDTISYSCIRGIISYLCNRKFFYFRGALIFLFSKAIERNILPYQIN